MENERLENLAVIILAAGKGKRMDDLSKSKVMATIDGKPLLQHVLDKIVDFRQNNIYIVVGYQKQSVINYINSSKNKVNIVEQNEQLGTGHAVNQTRKFLGDFDGEVIILCGDVPNLKKETIIDFVEEHYENESDVSVLTTITSHPDGYGRIIRDDDYNFLKIVEEKDTNDNEKFVKEINSGVYMIKAPLLFSALEKLNNNNNQGEYYLTDIIGILKSDGYIVNAIPAAGFEEILGVNTPEDLEKAEKLYFNLV